MNKPKYWKDIEELEQTEAYLKEANQEFPTDIPFETALAKGADAAPELQANRRDFLKLLGFGMTAATLSACVESPTKKSIPLTNRPDYMIPTVANYYASTTDTGIPVIVKSREGRPIKLEGNPDSFISKGGLDAIGHGTLLGLYDLDRLKSPKKGKNFAEWDIVDDGIKTKLEEITAAGGKVRVLSRTVLSPSTLEIINEFLNGFDDGKHIVYDPVSVSALLDAHQVNFDQRAIPAIHLEKAKVIASFGCDFLGTWLSPVEFAWKYVQNREPKNKWMSRHYQFESAMSVTGGKADLRYPIKPSQQGVAILNLFNKVASLLGRPTLPNVPQYNVAGNGLDSLANELVENKGESIILCGINDPHLQEVVLQLNSMLENYGNTLDIANPAYYKSGSDEDLAELVREMESGEVAALFLYDANPVYDTPYGEIFERALPSMELAVSFAYKEDETTEYCGFVCPDHHYLEAWGDARQTARHYSIIQPTIKNIFNTRQVQDSFLSWSGNDISYHNYLKNYCENNFYVSSDTYANFQGFWDELLRKGVLESEIDSDLSIEVSAESDVRLAEAAQSLTQSFSNSSGEVIEVVFVEAVGIRDGKYANNPWLQELPDPITRSTWDAYVMVPVSFAKERNISQGDILRINLSGDQTLELPAVIQPGQALGTLGVPVGYGRSAGGRVTDEVSGPNVFPMLPVKEGLIDYYLASDSVDKTGRNQELALVQTFNLLYDPVMGEKFGNDYDRSEAIVRETVFPFYKNPDQPENPYYEKLGEWEEKRKHLVSLWESHFEDPETSRLIRWAMVVDLNKCTGCGACVVACQTENNVPVVGRDEVRTRREMHWMRIDRYYSGDPDNPDVVFQPMMCQHCDNAPCETVCPVLATIHSNEGLNQMTYNRCVGTRYCANNCPYKVRRFNWFSYYNDVQFTQVNPAQSDLGRLVLNPDVTVRYRGVMEKCSFCVQRLQEQKLKAKIAANSSFAKPEDSRNFTACQSSCPTGAIVFGDLNDRNSEVSKLYYDQRGYHVIEEVKTLPSVKYMTLVRNRTKEEYDLKEEEQRNEQSYTS